jgi:hypothetical protein
MVQSVLDLRVLEPEQGGWFYSPTHPGRGQLEKQAADWERLSSAITQVVRLEEAATCAA